MAVTTKAKSNFSFRKLADKFDEVFDDYMEDSYEDLAQSARDTITSGKGLKPLSTGTKALRKRGFYSRGKKIKPTSGTLPLLHTGKLLRSIKATKDGVDIIGYAKYHLGEHEVVQPSKWVKRYAPTIQYLIVPPRNPFLTKTGGLKPAFKKGSDKRMKELIKTINKVWRTK